MIHCLSPATNSLRCFTPLLISFPYSSTHVTSGDGNSLIFTKTFYIMLCSLWIVRPGPSFFSPIIGRIPLKSVNSFLFVCSHRCKNSSPALPLAYKSTVAFASGMFTYQTATALPTGFKSSHNCICFCCFSHIVVFAF